MSRRRNLPSRITGFGLWAVVVYLFLLPDMLVAANHARWTTNDYNVTGSTIRVREPADVGGLIGEFCRRARGRLRDPNHPTR